MANKKRILETTIDQAKNTQLSKTMTVAQFDQGYWYATELKKFANEIGMTSYAKLRKDKLEKQIKYYLKTGKLNVTHSIKIRRSTACAMKDSDQKITSATKIINYTNDEKTKIFLDQSAVKKAPHLKKKSGDRYWLNRWREQQIEKGIGITYGDLVDHLVSLRSQSGRLPQIPSTRYNNFVTDFLAADSKATKTSAIQAWEKLKKLPVEKNYQSYCAYITSKAR